MSHHSLSRSHSFDNSTSAPSCEDERKGLTTAEPVLRTNSKGLQVFCMGFAVFLTILAPVVVLLLYILFIHEYQISSNLLLTSAPPGHIFSIVTVCTTIAPLTSTFVMGIEAYYLSRTWLVASRDGGNNRPTPLQYVCIYVQK